MFGFSSTFSLPTLTLPANWSAIRSMVGESWRHGPHHGAQKSATTRVPLVTYSFQLPSVSSITLGLAMSSGLPEGARPSVGRGALAPFYANGDTEPGAAPYAAVD